MSFFSVVYACSYCIEMCFSLLLYPHSRADVCRALNYVQTRRRKEKLHVEFEILKYYTRKRISLKIYCRGTSIHFRGFLIFFNNHFGGRFLQRAISARSLIGDTWMMLLQCCVQLEIAVIHRWMLKRACKRSFK